MSAFDLLRTSSPGSITSGMWNAVALVAMGAFVGFATCRALYTGRLLGSGVPEVRRKQEPVLFWVSFVSLSLMSAGCVFFGLEILFRELR